MIVKEWGMSVVYCDCCNELLGDYNSFDEAREAIIEEGWQTKRGLDGSYVNYCTKCQGR